MPIYVKLGKKANSFADTIAGITLSGPDVIEVTEEQLKSAKIKRAMAGGHLVRANRIEFNNFTQMIKSASSGITKGATESDKDKIIKGLQEKLMQSEADKAKLELELKNKEEHVEGPFDLMSDEELVTYYSENYEVSEKQIKTFSKLSTEDKIKELTELESAT